MSQQSEGPARDIVMIGGSAGAIESLTKLLKTVPAGFAGSIFVVIHTSAEGPGLLPRVLSRASPIPAIHPVDGQELRGNYIYVAPPDFHLTLATDNIIRLRKGPRENGFRPAIDPLFRSAATHGYGPRCIAVLLSGYLDDGAAGMYAVRRRGGVGIVQDPNEALAEEMPAQALRYAGADHVLPAAEIGAKLVELVNGAGNVITMKKKVSARTVKTETGNISDKDISPNALVAYANEGEGTPSVFACPDCHGVLWEIKEGGSVRYRCRTGHAYTEATLNEELSHAGEDALWAAMRALEEKASMARRMSEGPDGPEHWKSRLKEQACTYADHAEIIRKMIFGEAIGVEAKVDPKKPVKPSVAG